MPEDSPEISSGIFLDPPHCNRNLSMKRQLSFKTNIRHQNRLVGGPDSSNSRKKHTFLLNYNVFSISIYIFYLLLGIPFVTDR
ncbi:hypothetical protein ACM15_04310 [Parabacteroides goldsteinii]|uniref:Uncharacterized protein n=1 Tax=Parabacteroides goldsteinii TaxID=328812 RepID=A0A0J6CFP6_9BACT|nr:hypothetical protein ACM15_04310 [Parabacteroides goldsteinii]